MDVPVGSFLGWAEFPLGRSLVAGVTLRYVKSSEFHSLVVVLDHLLLRLRHFVRSFVSDLIQAIQVYPKLIVVAFFVECLSFNAGDSHLDWDHCLDAISESERVSPVGILAVVL